MLQVAGLAAYTLNTIYPAPSDSIAALMRSKLLTTSRPIFPWTKPKIIWNGLSAPSDTAAIATASSDNSTATGAGAHPVVLLVANATDAVAAAAA